jgi:hypothetical protein
MSHVISMQRPDNLRQTAVSDLSKVILCLVVRAKQHNHSAIAAIRNLISNIDPYIYLSQV